MTTTMTARPASLHVAWPSVIWIGPWAAKALFSRIHLSTSAIAASSSGHQLRQFLFRRVVGIHQGDRDAGILLDQIADGLRLIGGDQCANQANEEFIHMIIVSHSGWMSRGASAPAELDCGAQGTYSSASAPVTLPRAHSENPVPDLLPSVKSADVHATCRIMFSPPKGFGVRRAQSGSSRHSPSTRKR